MDEVNITRNEPTASEISVYQLVNVLSDAVFICDASGSILACSEQAVNFFGLSTKSRIIGSRFQYYISHENIDESYLFFYSIANEPNARKTGDFLVRKGPRETVHSAITFASIQTEDQSKKFVLITFREKPVTDPGTNLLQQKERRFSRLFDSISYSKGHEAGMISNILSQIGETLGATTCSYQKVDNSQLTPASSWESPFNTGISPQLGSQQLLDFLVDHDEKQTLIRKPLLNTFLDLENGNTENVWIKAILGFTIRKNNIIEGLITAIFTFNYSLSASDEQFLQAITSVLEIESFGEPKPVVQPEFSFRKLIDCFSDPVYVLSPEAIIMEVNKGVSRYYGYEREELIGQTPMLFSAEGKNDEQLIKQMFEKAFLGEQQKFEWWGRRKNGEVFLKEVFFNKSTYYDRDVVIAIGRDLTESKKVEQELLRYNKELLESNTSKDKFFSILAHDLKNPFQGLLGFIDLLYEDLDDLTNAQIKEYLSNVRTASYHTYALLENLLEWSRIQSGKMPFTPSVFNIWDEINSVISILDNNATRKEIKLINEVDPELMVEADRNMIHSVIQNLITNSIKFSNIKGKVVLRSRVPKTNAKTRIASEPGDRRWLEISISDNGIGIPEEIIPKLFRLNGQYSQAGTANEPGTGLGLVLCHEMVEKNGGRIWAESIAGQGATFIFTIPLSS